MELEENFINLKIRYIISYLHEFGSMSLLSLDNINGNSSKQHFKIFLSINFNSKTSCSLMDDNLFILIVLRDLQRI